MCVKHTNTVLCSDLKWVWTLSNVLIFSDISMQDFIHLQSQIRVACNMFKEVTEPCAPLTKHSFSCSLVERPRQRQSLGKTLQLHQTVNSLLQETWEKQQTSGPQRTFCDSAFITTDWQGTTCARWKPHQTYLPPGPESHDVSGLQNERIMKCHWRDTCFAYS